MQPANAHLGLKPVLGVGLLFIDQGNEFGELSGDFDVSEGDVSRVRGAWSGVVRFLGFGGLDDAILDFGR